MEKVLVLAPHADDAEFGVGGYLHRMAREKTAAAQVVIFAYGNYVRANGECVTFEERKAETAASLALLGADHKFVEGFYENYGDTGPSKLVGQIEMLIDTVRPDELFVCLPSFNQDHTALYRATITALRPGRADRVKRVWAYEYPGNCWGPEAPLWGHCYVRLSSEDFNAKMSALLEHASQGFGVDHARHVGMAGMCALAALRGSECGTSWAELFYLLREIY